MGKGADFTDGEIYLTVSDHGPYKYLKSSAIFKEELTVAVCFNEGFVMSNLHLTHIIINPICTNMKNPCI